MSESVILFRCMIRNKVVIPKTKRDAREAITMNLRTGPWGASLVTTTLNKPASAAVTIPINQFTLVSPICSLFSRELVNALYSSSSISFATPARFGESPFTVSEKCLLQTLCHFDHVLGVDTEFLHYLGARRAHPETAQTNNLSVETDILIPSIRNAGFDRDAFTTRLRQNFFTIFFRFALETFKARHGDNAHV